MMASRSEPFQKYLGLDGRGLSGISLCGFGKPSELGTSPKLVFKLEFSVTPTAAATADDSELVRG